MLIKKPCVAGVSFNWKCPFCGKYDMKVSDAGILYCSLCKKSYGQSIEEVYPGFAHAHKLLNDYLKKICPDMYDEYITK